MMNEKGVVRDRQRNVECYETGGKIGKITGRKTHIGNNLARQNDAKCPFYACVFAQKAFEK